MNHILISCCNGARWSELHDGGACLIVLNAATQRRENVVSARDISSAAEGVTGICRFMDGFAINVQGSGHTMIAKVTSELRLLGIIQTTMVRRPHSLISRGDYLYALSSGNDSIIRVDGREVSDPHKSVMCNSEVLVWTYNRFLRCVHANSLTQAPDGSLYITAFGSTEPAGPVATETGFLMEMRTRKRIISGLSEPHSAIACGSGFLYCESRRSVVKDLKGNILDLFSGYVRGLAATSDRIYVGVSQPRNQSISGSSVPLEDLAYASIGAELRVFSWSNYDLRTAREISRVSLRDIAREIFDIALF